MTQFLDLVLPPQGSAAARPCGVVTAVVTNNQDPEKLGRVRLRYPWLSDEQESDWARVGMPAAGPGRGLWLPPEVGDEVLVVFAQGDQRFPYVVGALWNQNAPPPEASALERRTLRSRSGHVVRLDDTAGGEAIEIVDGSGRNSIRIATADNAITITCDGDLTLESRQGKLVLKAAGGIEAASRGDVSVKAKTALGLEAEGDTKVTGKNIHLN
ncbi:MAG TPA: phage baseplate assembly protein V [Longimicrobium sp.]|nr:phage baseplate assembly protein V [Longimicrobium sp.]